ncbi:unnamed protein product [Pipistrellus nathusii]|uniref:Uncharacterized protein n=1 Tax=Pipistrellus nathusii TaxID=59473 RepID=A0ABN9ZDZ6_PIPNA
MNLHTPYLELPTSCATLKRGTKQGQVTDANSYANTSSSTSMNSASLPPAKCKKRGRMDNGNGRHMPPNSGQSQSTKAQGPNWGSFVGIHLHQPGQVMLHESQNKFSTDNLARTF